MSSRRTENRSLATTWGFRSDHFLSQRTSNRSDGMESSGEIGKVNISGSTYELIKDKFNCVHRGKIEAKNKGFIDMYFVEG